jgi:hypothetical protein
MHSQHMSIFLVYFLFFKRLECPCPCPCPSPTPHKKQKKTNYEITKILFDPKLKKISSKGKLVF